MKTCFLYDMKSMLSMVLQCQGNDIVRGRGLKHLVLIKLGYMMPVKSKKQGRGVNVLYAPAVSVF